MNRIKATIDRFEGNTAVLSLEDGQKIYFPKNKLPKNTKQGSVLWLSIFGDKEAELHQRKLAKEILNEILSGK